ncbi:MAG: fibronectin type III domain-containing protein [Bacteroidales bacterium]|nr:fibronectin type III domain-containing protein [Bacteroidales bacterium]
MKRIFAYITMLTLAVACETMYGPVETPLAPDSAAGVEITVADVTDDSFTVTITPSGEASYYSWLIDEASAAEELDAETLYAVGYESVDQGTVKWTAESSSYTFTVEDLNPNTDYQVYAVAGSKMGIAGTVVNKSVKTTDTVAPGYESYETDAHQVVFTFSEAVTRKADNGAIKVPYYAYYSADFQTTAAAAGEVTVPEDSILVAGNQALISVPDLPTGCYWTISIPEGAFVDVVGQKLPAYASAFVMAEGEYGPEPAPNGFYGEIDYVELPMLGALELESFSDWTAPFVIPIESEYAIAGMSSKKFVTVTYETQNKVIELTLTPGVHYGIGAQGFVVALPEQPEYGAEVTISVPAGVLYDVFGNDCEAWEATSIHSFGYTLEDVLGTYSGEAESYFQGPVSLGLTVSESDDAEIGNIMLTGTYMGITCMNPIYGNFNVDSGVLRIYDSQLFYQNETAGRVLFAVNGADYVDFKVPQSGVITSPSEWFGAYFYDQEGWYDVYTDCTLVRVEDAATSVATSKTPELKVRHSGKEL